jgi:hypothetical protein
MLLARTFSPIDSAEVVLECLAVLEVLQRTLVKVLSFERLGSADSLLPDDSPAKDEEDFLLKSFLRKEREGIVTLMRMRIPSIYSVYRRESMKSSGFV